MKQVSSSIIMAPIQSLRENWVGAFCCLWNGFGEGFKWRLCGGKPGLVSDGTVPRLPSLKFFLANARSAAEAAIHAVGVGLKYERQVYGSRLKLHFGSTWPDAEIRISKLSVCFRLGRDIQAVVTAETLSTRFDETALYKAVVGKLNLSANSNPSFVRQSSRLNGRSTLNPA